MNKQDIFKGFNNHFVEFIEDIHSIFPNDKDIIMTRDSLLLLKKSNPKIIIDVWYKNITLKYQSEIQNGNIDFFLTKDYNEDLNMGDQKNNKVLEAIEKLRQPIKNMGDENQDKCLKYIQNLTQLSSLYFN